MLLLLAASAAIAAAGPLGKTVTLRGGVVMPTVGLGSSGGCHPDPTGSEKSGNFSGYTATAQAIKLGYRGFHDALSYGNQACVGAAIKDSGIPRSEFFMMSMVPKYLMGYKETLASVAASLDQLQVEYIDLVMVHHRAADFGEWPRTASSMKAFPDDWAGAGNPVNDHPGVLNGGKATWQPPPCAVADATWLGCQDGTWKALTELKAQGKLKAIGVSNWMKSNLERMKALGQELPAVNQVEAHIGWHDDELLDWCAANGVVIQAATPLSRALPALVKPGAHPVVTGLATKYNKTCAQISLRYLVETGIAIIPSTSSKVYQAENLDLFDFKLTAVEVAALGAIAVPCRGAPTLGLMKCWADPNEMMCANSTTGKMFHCP